MNYFSNAEQSLSMLLYNYTGKKTHLLVGPAFFHLCCQELALSFLVQMPDALWFLVLIRLFQGFI